MLDFKDNLNILEWSVEYIEGVAQVLERAVSKILRSKN